MFEEFMVHNLFKESIKKFEANDPQLKKLRVLPFKYKSSLMDTPYLYQPGIYVITGGRQVGKTTFLKQFILNLLEKKKLNPEKILFLTGELINSQAKLQRIAERAIQDSHLKFLLIDEISYIPDWDKAIKFLADAGLLDNTTVILTGSDNHIIKTAMQRFPGRRGKSDQTNFIFQPLSFTEYIILRAPKLTTAIQKIQKDPWHTPSKEYERHIQKIDSIFKDYLIVGGYLPAIGEYWQKGTIPKYVFNTYTEWIIGDMLKHNKSESNLYEIIKGILESYGSQVSWNSLSKYMSIDHHKTVSDYCELMEQLHIINIISALDFNKLRAAPKKSKKIHFRDPFIFHTASTWLSQNFSIENIKSQLENPEFESMLVESVVTGHCNRKKEAFYIKGVGEIDVAILLGKKIQPIEVKWTTQIRSKDLKEIQKHKNGIILTKGIHINTIGENLRVPVSRFLLSLDHQLS
ncbi:MAG: ATP-binding protein [Candidatus Margulisbacteria bacterium]|nr:ATP-binding protein [Candidatus Margulisiibacteriota bacterium]